MTPEHLRRTWTKIETSTKFRAGGENIFFHGSRVEVVEMVEVELLYLSTLALPTSESTRAAPGGYLGMNDMEMMLHRS